MLGIHVICVGKLKEKFYHDAQDEYRKRISACASINIIEIGEVRADLKPEIQALRAEAELITAKIPSQAYVIALCVEGSGMSSEKFADTLGKLAVDGRSKLCFIIGGSNGLHPDIKEKADLKLSFSHMTFPHHLARIMVLEQIYRATNILSGGKYHK